MKILLWILVSICLAVAVMSVSEGVQKLKDKRNKAIEECKKEKPEVSEADFSVVKMKDEPKNDIQHCIFECIYEKMEMLKGGKLNKEEINKVTQIRHGHNQTLFREEDYLSKSCQSEVEKSYATIKKCGIPNAYHSCVAKKRADRLAKPKNSNKQNKPKLIR